MIDFEALGRSFFKTMVKKVFKKTGLEIQRRVMADGGWSAVELLQNLKVIPKDKFCERCAESEVCKMWGSRGSGVFCIKMTDFNRELVKEALEDESNS